MFLPPLAGQQDSGQPATPIPENVTVDPSTGSCTITWLPSQSPDVVKYIIYATDNLYELVAIDSVDSPIAEYLHINSFARYKSVGYSIAARSSSGKISPISNPLWTVFLATENDSCNSSIVLRWTPHRNPAHPSTRYEVWLSEAGSTAFLHQTLPKADTMFRFQTNLPGTQYCFFIRALNDQSTYISASNRSCITTGREAAPAWVRIDAISVESGGITVSASYDDATDLLNYNLLRFSPAGSAWETVALATGNAGRVQFAVPSADTATVRVYRITAVNGCGVKSTLSDPVRHMRLDAAISGTHIELRWNRPVTGGPELFSVWRDTGKGMEEVARDLNDTIWSEDYTQFDMEISSSSMVYRISASDPSSPSGTPVHRSTAALIEATENIFMPNAFTPGRGNENAIFRPEFSFMPEVYDFRVFTRNGVLLFRSTDHGEGWDGMNRGTLQPPGVYLWKLRLVTPSGQTVVRNGTVTILP